MPPEGLKNSLYGAEGGLDLPRRRSANSPHQSLRAALGGEAIPGDRFGPAGLATTSPAAGSTPDSGLPTLFHSLHSRLS